MTQTCLDFEWKVVEAESEEALAEALRRAGREDLFLAGEPRPLSFLALDELKGRRVTFIDLKPMKRIVDYEVADQVIGVETGIALKELDAILIENNQWLPVRTASPANPLSEIVTTGDGGYLEHAFGGPRDLVLGLKVMLSTGETINTGGKVVKNVTGYDLTKLFVGGGGALGIPIAANLRLFARPESAHTLAALSSRPSELIELSSRIVRSGLPVVALELISADAFQGREEELQIMRSRLRGEIEDKLSGQKSHACALLCQVAGNSRVVKEVVPLLRSLLKSNGGQVLDQSHIPEDPSLIRLFDPQDGEPFREISASMSQMRDILSRLEKQNEAVSFSARPGSGRLRFYKKGSAAEFERLVTSFIDGLEVGGAREEDTSIASIERRLKERFDPSGLFPPSGNRRM